jgi:hypothetical protein
MTFFNWADSEEMFGLLLEYVADERSESGGDPARERFLAALQVEISDVGAQFSAMSTEEAADALRSILRSQPREFASDPALVHVADCVEELERINGQRCS